MRPPLVERVIESFAQTPVADAAPDLSISDQGQVATLREAFVAAGAAHVRQLATPTCWLQVGVSFHDATSARRFIALPALHQTIDRWLQEEYLEQFFFMRKAPGLRLRFALPHGTSESPIVEQLDQWRTIGVLQRYQFGLYDPETHQFGGPAGLDAIHRHATVDSLAYLQFADLHARGNATVDPLLFSLIVLHDLIGRVAEDPWEQWDVWCELRLTGRLVPPDGELGALLAEELADNRELLEAVLLHREDVLDELTPSERALVRAMASANATLVADWNAAIASRTLSCPPRKILPFLIIFHWNRVGLDLGEQMALTYFVEAMLNPKEART